MSNIRELNMAELDAVSGATGSISDVMTYVQAYTAALGTVETKTAPPASSTGGHGCPKGCHSPE